MVAQWFRVRIRHISHWKTLRTISGHRASNLSLRPKKEGKKVEKSAVDPITWRTIFIINKKNFIATFLLGRRQQCWANLPPVTSNKANAFPNIYQQHFFPRINLPGPYRQDQAQSWNFIPHHEHISYWAKTAWIKVAVSRVFLAFFHELNLSGILINRLKTVFWKLIFVEILAK